jgi:hypothetical protein
MGEFANLRRGLTAVGLAFLAAAILEACDKPAPSAYNVTPTMVGKPYYPGNGTREVMLDSPRRDQDGEHKVTEWCEGNTYSRYDPEVKVLEREGIIILNVPSTQRIGGPAAQAACADGRLEPGDPEPSFGLSPN